LQIFIGINIKWFFRLILGIFWVIALYMTASGQGFLTWLITEHVWTTITLLTLTFYFLLGPFYAPFVTIKTEGGEKVMERSTKILMFLAAILGALVVAMAIEDSRTVILRTFSTGVLAPIGSAIGGFNLWLGAFEPLHIVGAAILGGLLLAVMVNMYALPRIRRSTYKPTKPYMGEPDPIPPTRIDTPNPIKKTTTTTITETPVAEETEPV